MTRPVPLRASEKLQVYRITDISKVADPNLASNTVAMKDSVVILLCILAAGAAVALGFAVFHQYQKQYQPVGGLYETNEELGQMEYRRRVRLRNQQVLAEVAYREGVLPRDQWHDYLDEPSTISPSDAPGETHSGH